MSLNQTPVSERVHIGIFGKRNSGKSSILNALANQEHSIVSEVKGTTTDPVYKTMELLPLGPVVLIDTPGIDDEGELGRQRVRKSCQVLNKADFALVIIDASAGMSQEDEELLEHIVEKQLPYLIVFNKADLLPVNSLQNEIESQILSSPHAIAVSAETGKNIEKLKQKITDSARPLQTEFPIISDLIQPMDAVILVVPIDKAAPKGRLILPQQQTIREILDVGAVSVAVRETELKQTLEALGSFTKLVITDSRVFKEAAGITPENIPLSSFSILFARYKGDLETCVKGVMAVNHLEENDTVLISEGCTHHRQCEDIGTVKLPHWLSEYTGLSLRYEFTSGTEFPEDLSGYQLIVHCGGCMINEREMKYRMKCASDWQVPFTNYGILIAYMQGILKRSVELFPEISAMLGPEEE